MKPIIFLLIILLSYSATAQVRDIQIAREGNFQIIQLKDGTKLIGRVTEISGDSIQFESSISTVYIKKENITSIKEVASENIKNGQYWYENPHPTRYLYGPSAIPLKRGEGYYHVANISLNSVNYAFTNNFSMGAGLEILSTVLGYPIYTFNAKLSGPVTENLYAGGGFISIGMLPLKEDNWVNSGNATLGFGILTYGNKNSNITFGAGYPIQFKYEQVAVPSFSLSGMARVSRRMAFVSENYLIGSHHNQSLYYGVFSYGLRFMSENISLDFAFINNPDIASFLPIGIPYVDFAVKF